MTACITQGWGRQALLISRHFPLTTSYACSRFKSSSMSADAKVVLIGADKEKKSMTFEELRKIAQQQDTRMLIKVALPSAKGDMLPAFKLLTATELDNAVKVARNSESGRRLIYERVDVETGTVEGRVKEKRLTLKATAEANVVDVAAANATKYLRKGLIVRMAIEKSSPEQQEAAQELERGLKQRLAEAMQDGKTSDWSTRLHIDLKKGGDGGSGVVRNSGYQEKLEHTRSKMAKQGRKSREKT